jgi:hypothetical protein
MLGDNVVADVTATVERHGEHVVDNTTLLVTGIRAAFCRYEATPDDPEGNTHRPVPGTTVLVDLPGVVGSPEPLDDLEWLGYVVTARQ